MHTRTSIVQRHFAFPHEIALPLLHGLPVQEDHVVKYRSLFMTFGRQIGRPQAPRQYLFSIVTQSRAQSLPSSRNTEVIRAGSNSDSEEKRRTARI